VSLTGPSVMHSFSTSKDTKEYLSKSHADLINEPDVELMQNKSPKVDAATLEPATFPEDPDQEWQVTMLSSAPMLFTAQLRTHPFETGIWLKP